MNLLMSKWALGFIFSGIFFLFFFFGYNMFKDYDHFIQIIKENPKWFFSCIIPILIGFWIHNRY